MFSTVLFRQYPRAFCGLAAGFTLMMSYAQADTPRAIEALEAQGLVFVQEFDVNSDLRAFAGLASDQPIAIYVTPNGEAIVGTRLDANGEPLDAVVLEELVTKPMHDKTWAQLEAATWVLDGQADAPRVLYTFTDANCPYCHQFWEAARPWVESGKVQLRHILVGLIRADSPAKAAAILGAPDPSDALAENELAFERGGITPVESVPADVRKILEGHQALMLSTGFRGTPGIVVRENDGSIKKFYGMLQGEQLSEALGAR